MIAIMMMAMTMTFIPACFLTMLIKSFSQSHRMDDRLPTNDGDNDDDDDMEIVVMKLLKSMVMIMMMFY